MRSPSANEGERVPVRGRTRRLGTFFKALAGDRRRLKRRHAVLLATGVAFASNVATAKTPGEVHCYNGICHRVKTLDEMKHLVGVETEAITSFYDSADRDAMNAGTITSSGERFDAESDGHAASSLYPDGTELLIWNPKNRQAAHIRVNDFGPFYMLRTIDVTRRVAELMDFNKSGVARLKVYVVWAPNPDAARFRRRRIYPQVEGFIGRLDYDQLISLKARLIDTAAERNTESDVLAALARPAASLKALPAFGGPVDGQAALKAQAAVLNTPMLSLTESNPYAAATARPQRYVFAQRAGDAAQARAPTILAREAAGVAVPATVAVIADVAAVPQQATVVAAASQPVPQAASVTKAAAAAPMVTVAAAPSDDGITSVLASLAAGPVSGWQPVAGLLAALSLISAAAWSRRIRTAEIVDGLAALTEIPKPAADKPTLVADHDDDVDALAASAGAAMDGYDLAGAERALRRLVILAEKSFGAVSAEVGNAARNLADCLREQGRHAAAAPYYGQALEAVVRQAGPHHPSVADVLDAKAVCLMRQGHGRDAERTARDALAIRRLEGATTREHAVSQSILAEAMRCQGKLVAAEAEHRAAWATFIMLGGQNGLDSAASMTSIGTVLGELNRFGPAEEMLNAGTQIITSICGSDHPVSATGYALLGDLYLRAEALDAARTMHEHALLIRTRALGERHPDTVESLLTLGLVAQGQYRPGEAMAYEQRALAALDPEERRHFGPQSKMRGLLVRLAAHARQTHGLALAAE